MGMTLGIRPAPAKASGTTKGDQPMKLKFRNWECFLKKRFYSNGRLALELADVETGECMAVATTNLPDVELDADEICVKSYSENAGMLEALFSAGLIHRPSRFIRSGFVTIPICKINFNPGDLNG